MRPILLQIKYETIQDWGHCGGGGGDREVLLEQLRCWQLPHRRERCYFIGEAEGGGEALLAWPPQLPAHSSQLKFIILFRNM
jgi:hypothetical protein